MSGFRKAKAEQAALKVCIYGAPGSGKTFTSLLMAEGLAKRAGKRIAYVDTERGTDFYCQDVKERAIHPAAFDFDAIYSRSIMEITDAVRSIDPKDYAVVIFDSITHLWMAAKAAYAGKTTKVGTIPFHAWGKIKKPYKDLEAFMLNSPMHYICCGRQGIEYETDEESEELKAVGYKVKAEGETPYEPHILIRMEAIKQKRSMEQSQIVAYIEKDRTGILNGRSFINPTFDTLCVPLLGLLGDKQAQVKTEDENANQDAERIAIQDVNFADQSSAILKEFGAKITLAGDAKALKDIGKTIIPQVKAKMTPADVASLREAYQAREKELPA